MNSPLSLAASSQSPPDPGRGGELFVGRREHLVQIGAGVFETGEHVADPVQGDPADGDERPDQPQPLHVAVVVRRQVALTDCPGGSSPSRR